MLRIAIIAIGFLGITVGLLLLQPGRDRAPSQSFANAPEAVPVPQAAQVARAETGFDLTAPALGAGAVNPDPLGPAVALSAPPPASAAAAHAIPRDELQALTASVLAGLNAAGGAPRADPAQDDLRAMTSSVLASLGAAISGTGAATGPAPQKLESLIVQALRQGQSDAYLDALLNEAASTGQIAVPAALITSDGRVDTVILLTSLVEKSSTGQTGIDTRALAAAAGAARPAPRPAQRLTRAEVYVVQPGDSLASISFRFYGETVRYKDIFAANQDRLASPDKIRIGQRLTIPVL